MILIYSVSNWKVTNNHLSLFLIPSLIKSVRILWDPIVDKMNQYHIYCSWLHSSIVTVCNNNHIFILIVAGYNNLRMPLSVLRLPDQYMLLIICISYKVLVYITYPCYNLSNSMLVIGLTDVRKHLINLVLKIFIHKEWLALPLFCIQ